MESSDFSFFSIETHVFQGRIEDTSRDLGPQEINQAFSFHILLGSRAGRGTRVHGYSRVLREIRG